MGKWSLPGLLETRGTHLGGTVLALAPRQLCLWLLRRRLDTKCASVHSRLSLSVCIWYPASCYFAVMLFCREWAHGHTNTNGTVLSAVCPACPTGHRKPRWGFLRRKEANAFQCLIGPILFPSPEKGILEPCPT